MSQVEKQKYSRRVAIGRSLLFLGGIAGSMYVLAPNPSRVASTQDSRTVPPPSPTPQTSSFLSEAHMGSKAGLFEVKFSQSDLDQPIGLQQLYLGISSEQPVVLVCGMWDKATNQHKREQPLQAPGFQRIAEPFVPNPSSLRQNWMSGQELEEAIEWSAFTAAHLSEITKGQYLGGSVLSTAALVARPEPGVRQAMIFPQGVTLYRGQPSPLSYLKMGFEFDRQPNPKAV